MAKTFIGQKPLTTKFTNNTKDGKGWNAG